MRYWIIAVPRDVLEQCIDLGVYGRKSNQKLLPVEKDDGIVCYASGEYKIVAVGKVTKPYYVDQRKIFKSSKIRDDYSWRRAEVNDVYEHRIGFQADWLAEGIDFKPLIEKLDFIKKPEYWPAYIRRGFTEISKDDWQLITKTAKVHNKR